MSTSRKIIAITKRTAELCGSQALLYGAGLELVTATSMPVARGLIGALRIRGVIVCRHSWTDEERESLVAELAAKHPEVSVVMRCPGCTGCDELTHTPGTLCDTIPLTTLVTAIRP